MTTTPKISQEAAQIAAKLRELLAPLTQLDLSNGQIKLYAKWSEDQALRDQESAELVDIYIYNLSTNRAKRTKVTVGYVLDMYETLSENAKSLVQEYETLETWAKQLTK